MVSPDQAPSLVMTRAVPPEQTLHRASAVVLTLGSTLVIPGRREAANPWLIALRASTGHRGQEYPWQWPFSSLNQLRVAGLCGTRWDPICVEPSV
jgi:hypothetical protein